MNCDTLAQDVVTTITGALVDNPVLEHTTGYDWLCTSKHPEFRPEPPGTEYMCESRSRLIRLVPLQHTHHLFIRASVPVTDQKSDTVSTVTVYFTIPVIRSGPVGTHDQFSVMDPALALPLLFRKDVKLLWLRSRTCARPSCENPIAYHLGACPSCRRSWHCAEHAVAKAQHELDCRAFYLASEGTTCVAPETVKRVHLQMTRVSWEHM